MYEMQPTFPVSLHVVTQLDVPIFRLHADMLVAVGEQLPIQDLVRLARVCRAWRAVLFRCNWIWGRLNLRHLGDHAIRMAVALFPRSGDALLDLGLRLTSRVPDGTIRNLLQCLAPHARRLRHLALESTSPAHYQMLLGFLRNPMPHLYSLDVSAGAVSFWDWQRVQVQPPNDMVTAAPSLVRLHWDTELMPSSLNCLGNVTHLRISPSRQTLPRIFTLFPHMTHLWIDRRAFEGDIQPLPVAHPLQRLKLCENPPPQGVIRDRADKIAWSTLERRGVTRVRLLFLSNSGLSALFAACEAGWQAHTLSIEYDDTVDATLARGAQECRMQGLVSGDRSMELAWSVGKLLYRRACLRDLVSLTMSLFRPAAYPRAWSVLPCIVLHALDTFTLICGQPPPSREPVCSLLDDSLLRVAGPLRAPNLRTMRLQARTPQGDNDDEIPAAQLACFLGEHIQLQDGARLTELRVDHPRVRFSDDPEGLAALTSLVDTLVYRI